LPPGPFGRLSHDRIEALAHPERVRPVFIKFPGFARHSVSILSIQSDRRQVVRSHFQSQLTASALTGLSFRGRQQRPGDAAAQIIWTHDQRIETRLECSAPIEHHGISGENIILLANPHGSMAVSQKMPETRAAQAVRGETFLELLQHGEIVNLGSAYSHDGLRQVKRL
jgi:hypothetical protein